MPNPTVMPSLPTMVNPQDQDGMMNPLRNLGYFSDGSNPNPSPNAGFEHGPDPNLSPGASFDLRGGSNDGLGGFNMPSSPTPSTGSESDMRFFDLLNQYK